VVGRQARSAPGSPWSRARRPPCRGQERGRRWRRRPTAS
jgi:hypothetical protein